MITFLVLFFLIQATGDDMGVIKIWDLRMNTVYDELHENGDYISDFDFDSKANTLFATSGDGYITAYEIKTKKFGCSLKIDDDLLTIKLMKNFERVVVGNFII
jgi:WD repeat-containing protein 55